MKIIRNFTSITRKVQILWGADVSKPSLTPNNFSLHNIYYEKLHIIEEYTYDSETKYINDPRNHIRISRVIYIYFVKAFISATIVSTGTSVAPL